MELELKHIAPYLPYGIRYKFETMTGYYISNPLDITDRDAWQTLKDLDKIKLLLNPMSILNREILESAGFNSHVDYLTHELQNDLNSDRLDSMGKKLWRIEKAPYEMVDFLFRNHFDVFGLIEKGLAINTLNK